MFSLRKPRSITLPFARQPSLTALLLLLIAAAIALTSPRAWSMSYMPMSDDALADSADAIVSGRIIGASGAAGRELEETTYRLAVDEVIKGRLQSSEIEVHLPGAYDQTARGALIVPGTPRFAQDEPVLLFLNERSDRSYSPSQLLLGVFRVREGKDDEIVLSQDLEQAEAVGESHNGHHRYRDAGRFSNWLRGRSRGEHGEQGEEGDDEYWCDTELKPEGKYQLSSPQVRWFSFDRGLQVPIYANEDSTTDSSEQALMAAINAWNNAPGSNIALSYSGLSKAASGLALGDGVNQVLFNDPNNELQGTFDCLLGGLGAYGKWRSLGTASFNGETYGLITEGDIVVQDGIECLLSGRRNENAEELLAHELGHVLGLGHSCGDGLLASCVSGTAADDALMRPTLHGNGRGATLASDDIAGAAKLYGASSSGGSTGGSSGGENSGSGGGESSAGGGSFDALTLGLLMLAVLGFFVRGQLMIRCASQQRRAV